MTVKLTAVITTDGPFKGHTFDLESPESQPEEWKVGDKLHYVGAYGDVLLRRSYGGNSGDRPLIATGNAHHTEAEALHFRDHDPRSYAWNCAFTTVRNFIRDRFGLDGEWKKGEENWTGYLSHDDAEMNVIQLYNQYNNLWHVRTEDQARAVLDELADECKVLWGVK